MLFWGRVCMRENANCKKKDFILCSWCQVKFLLLLTPCHFLSHIFQFAVFFLKPYALDAWYINMCTCRAEGGHGQALHLTPLDICICFVCVCSTAGLVFLHVACFLLAARLWEHQFQDLLVVWVGSWAPDVLLYLCRCGSQAVCEDGFWVHIPAWQLWWPWADLHVQQPSKPG